jgi:hypothetical protein
MYIVDAVWLNLNHAMAYHETSSCDSVAFEQHGRLYISMPGDKIKSQLIALLPGYYVEGHAVRPRMLLILMVCSWLLC